MLLSLPKKFKALSNTKRPITLEITPVTRINTKVVKFILILPKIRTLRIIISKEIKIKRRRLLLGKSALRAKKKYTIFNNYLNESLV